jgi:GDPmannose 4,6-dehydratase
MTKKAFITGVSGQDGSLLAEVLLGKGYEVYGLMKETSSKDNLETILENKNFNLIYGDLLNNDLICFLLRAFQFDEIYNLASQSNIRLSYNNPLLTFNVTLIGTLVLLENIKKHSPKSKMFQAGSSAMFGTSIDEDGFQRETTLFNPISPYASSKLFAHNICCNYRTNDNLFISNGILYNHESLKSKTLSGIINVVIENAIDIKKGKISTFHIPNLDICIDWGHALDYVEGMWKILQQDKPSDYIISSGKSFNIRYICNYVFNKLDLNYEDYITTDDNNILTPVLIGDSSKLKGLGWKPKYSINRMLDEIINFQTLKQN